MRKPLLTGQKREWMANAVMDFKWSSKGPVSPIDVFSVRIGDMTLDAEGNVFLETAAYKRGDPIDHKFGGYHAYRQANSSELRIIDPLGYETRYKFKAFIWCDIVWVGSSIWFRLLPRGGAVIHGGKID
jgi:hypothetical protein